MNVETLIRGIAKEQCPDGLAGIAIGVIVGDKRYQVVDGFSDHESETPLTTDALFEIGSITKVFCSLLLAKFAIDGRLDLDDSATSALPDGVSLPTDGLQDITFRNLANHSSSLPRLPNNLDGTIDDQADPYANYQVEDLYMYLANINSVDPIGKSEEYSNLGFGILGHLLGRIDQSSFAAALTHHVLNPLAMGDTAIALTPDQSRRLATAHNSMKQPTQHWNFTDAMVAAGGIRSSLPDMLTFLELNLNPERSTLQKAIELTHRPDPIEKKSNDLPWLLILAAALSLASVGIQRVFEIGPPGFIFLLLVVLPAVLTGYFGKIIPSLAAAGFTTLLTRWLWGPGFNGVSALFIGGILACAVSEIFKLTWQAFQTDSRLGWQSSAFGEQELLWHNGQVGGAASFLGFLPGLGAGVVVLTNSDTNVDGIGIEILEKLAHRSEENH